MSVIQPIGCESWRPVVGFENLYAVSNFGRIRTFQYRRRYGRGRFRMMKLVPHNRGYWMVTFQVCRQRFGRLAHRLVYESFVGPITDDEVRSIRQMYATGEYTYQELGRMFKVNWYTIRRIVKRWEWKWVS